MSDTTNLASAATGVELFDHIRHAVDHPGFAIALLIFALLGSANAHTPGEIAALQQSPIGTVQYRGCTCCLPLVSCSGWYTDAFPRIPRSCSAPWLARCSPCYSSPKRLSDWRMPCQGRFFFLLKGIWMSLFGGLYLPQRQRVPRRAAE